MKTSHSSISWLVYSIIGGFLLLILVIALFLIKKDEIVRLFAKPAGFIIRDLKEPTYSGQKEPAPVYTYPLLELKLVEDDQQKLEQAYKREVPAEDEFKDEGDGKILVRKEAAMILDRYLLDAYVEYGSFGEPFISIALNKEGAEAFYKLTQENIDKRLAIVFNGKVMSAPVIREPIPGGHMQITGRFDVQSANEMIKPLKFVIKNRPKKK